MNGQLAKLAKMMIVITLDLSKHPCIKLSLQNLGKPSPEAWKDSGLKAEMPGEKRDSVDIAPMKYFIGHRPVLTAMNSSYLLQVHILH